MMNLDDMEFGSAGCARLKKLAQLTRGGRNIARKVATAKKSH
jgi:hypothetical protein